MKRTSFIQANSSGRLHRADEIAIAPLNRGYLYGDAIYEVWRTYDGVIFGWEAHWARLLRSAAALYMELPFTATTILAEIRRTATAFRNESGFRSDLYIRLQVTRGGGEIGLDTALADGADYTVLVKPVPTLSETQLERGQRLSVVTGLRRNPAEALDPLWKTGNYLNNLLCLREVRTRGADEALILNLAGELTEAAVCNVGFVRDGEIVTPPLSAGILAGITRGLLLDKIAARAGVRAREQSLRPEDLGSMEEAFLLSTTKDLQPVGSIDGYIYKTGPATLTRRVKAIFADYAHEVAAARRAELAV